MTTPYPIPPEMVDRWRAVLPRRFLSQAEFRRYMETPCRALDDMTPGHVVRVGGAKRVVELLEAEEETHAST